METKICTKCKVKKELTEFGTRPNRKGIIFTISICKICVCLKTKTWYESNKKKPGLTYKLDIFGNVIEKKCTRCQEYKLIINFRNKKIKSEIVFKHLHNASCRDCENLRQKNYRQQNHEKYLNRIKLYKLINKDKIKQQNDVYNKKTKEQKKVRAKIYRQKMKAKLLTECNIRRTKKIQACPKWADLNKIALIYKQREIISVETGVIHHVDHQIPLTHPLVCGLHIEHNLHVIPAIENLTKNNKFTIE